MRRIGSYFMTVIVLLSLLTPRIITAEENDTPSIEDIMRNMTPKEKIGQLVMPDTQDSINQTPNEDTEKLIKEYFAGSVIIYGSYDAITTANYTNQLQTWAKETETAIPLFISADLEYGAAQHVTDATVFPRLMGIGATNDLSLAKKVAAITAREAKAVGYNWNFSPAIDVNVNPTNPVIGVRAFSEDVDLVTSMGIAMIEGHQENGVIATAKHFPGHGDTQIDSHIGMDIVSYDRHTLDKVHLPPFKAAIEAGVDAIMTSHIIVEAIDPDLPATLSEKVLTGLLREELGFDGLIVTDAMDMGAITNNFGRGEAAVMAIQAGADVIIAKGSYQDKIDTFEGLYDAYESGDLTLERIDASVERILRKKMDHAPIESSLVDPEEAKDIVGAEAHEQFAEEVALQSITLLKNDSVLPFDPSTNESTILIGPKIYNQTHYIDAIADKVSQGTKGTVKHLVVSDDPSSKESKKAIKTAKKYDRVIVATFSASELPAGQSQLVRELSKINNQTVAISLGLPYDIQHYPDIAAYIATYAIERWGSPVPPAWEAAVDVIFGAQASGKLPVSIDGHFAYGDGISLDSTLLDPSFPNEQALSDAEKESKAKYIIPLVMLAIGIVTISFLKFKKYRHRI